MTVPKELDFLGPPNTRKSSTFFYCPLVLYASRWPVKHLRAKKLRRIHISINWFYLIWWPKLVTSNLRQTVTVRESLTSKIEVTLVAKFGKKISLWRVRHGAKKVWHAVVVAAYQTAARKTIAWLTCDMARFGHGPNMPKLLYTILRFSTRENRDKSAHGDSQNFLGLLRHLWMKD
jgi:hypothetical protein